MEIINITKKALALDETEINKLLEYFRHTVDIVTVGEYQKFINHIIIQLEKLKTS